LTPELSYASATILAEQLFLRRVSGRAAEMSCTPFPSPLSSFPAFSVCRRGWAHPHGFGSLWRLSPFCFPLAGAEQAKLVCELVEECLEPDCLQLVLSQVLEVPLSEKLLPIVQAVLGRQEVLPTKLFDLLVLTLCRQAPAFATSLNYAKLVTAVLTMYQNQVS
ncbi:FANCE protein, partial [Chloroceryle aenea]|nr:FANCE protein [Chloroceryle aenea]